MQNVESERLVSALVILPSAFPLCGCGSTAECGRAKAETTVRLRSPAPLPSLWCSPDNMPASHAGDHRSEAGQGRHVQALKALSAMHSLGKRFSPVQFRVRAPRSQSGQCSSGFHKPAVSGAAPETATIVASMQQPAEFFCKEFLPEHHRLETPFTLLA